MKPSINPAENVHEIYNEAVVLLGKKEKVYATKTNRFENFEAVGAWTRIDPITVAFIFTAKHLDAIRRWAMDPETYDPPWDSFVDVLNYFGLMIGLWKVAQQEKNK